MNQINTTLTENVIFAATELGISIIREVAKEALANKPTMSLYEFTKVMEQYVARAKAKVRNPVPSSSHIA